MNLNTAKIEIMLAERGMTKAALAGTSGISRQSVSTIIEPMTCLTTAPTICLLTRSTLISAEISPISSPSITSGMK